MRKKYAAFLPDLATRNDLFRVIQWMLSELSVGHSYQGPGDSAFEAETIPGGLLGADYEVANGRYRFRKVFGGLNWSPDLRSPLTEPGVDVKAGEYLLAVEGQDLRHPGNLYEPFERTGEPDRRDHGRARRPTARARARSRWCRSRTSGRCATATGSRATSDGHGGDAGARGLRLRPEHRRGRPPVLQALLLPPGRPPGRDRGRAAQRRRLRGRLLHRHPAPAGGQLLGHALRGRPQDADRRDPRAEGHADRRDRRLGRRPPAVDVPQVLPRPARRASGRGAASWGSWASPC